MQDSKIEISKIKRKKPHFPQIVEDCVSDCQRLSSARTRTRNSFSSFNPPRAWRAFLLMLIGLCHRKQGY